MSPWIFPKFISYIVISVVAICIVFDIRYINIIVIIIIYYYYCYYYYYYKIYLSGSMPSTIYGLPKTRKLLSNDFQDLPFRSVVSSFATYNYDLAKFLSELLDPVIPNEHCAKDSFTFCEEIQWVSANDCFFSSI